jgi:hypothetical protein
MSFFEQLLQAVWAMRPANPARFWLIWITLTAAAAICVASAGGRVAAPRSQKPARRPISLNLTWRQVGAPRAVATLVLLAVFLAFYIAVTLVWEDFAYYDNANYTLYTLKGRDFPLVIARGDGRFTPLSDQEFNLIRHFTDTITGYHMLPIAQLLMLCGVLLILDDELSITARAALAILALLTPSILTSFNGLIFPERNVLFFLVCLALSVKRFEQTHSIASAVAAVVCAQIMIYYKETAFLLVLGFAASRLILRCRNAHDVGWDYGRLLDKESRLDLCLSSLAVPFLLYYFAEMGIHPSMNYADVRRHPLVEILLDYVRLDLLAWLFMAVVLGRIYLILRCRVTPLLLWDGLACGAVPYFFAFLYLRIFAAWYLAPVDLIAVLYVGRFAVLSWKKMRSWSKIAALMVAFAVLLQDVLLSAWVVFERKNGIHAKLEIARVVETRYRSSAGKDFRLFFPLASPYVADEFAHYLNYRGVPAEGAEWWSEAVGPNGVVLATRAVAKDGPGVGWISLRDHAVSGPHSGDLVIVLPDDEGSLAEASLYRERGELLFSYEPRPPMPQWLYSLVGSLRMLPPFGHKAPDRWMDGSVTAW